MPALDASPEGDLIKLVEHGLVETLADAVGLRALTFVRVCSTSSTARYSSYDVLGVAAILGPSIRQDPAEDDVVLLEERQHAVVEQVRSGIGVFVSYSFAAPPSSTCR